MKRILLTLVAACSLVLGAAAAQADQPGSWTLPHGWEFPQPKVTQAIVAGTITSVAPAGGTAGTFDANASLISWHGLSPESTSTTPVTIALAKTTTIAVAGVKPGTATVTDLLPVQHFFAVYDVRPGESLADIVAGSPISVSAYLPTVCVAGTITSVDSTAGSIAAGAYLMPSWWCDLRHHFWHGPVPVVSGVSGWTGGDQNSGSSSGNQNSGSTDGSSGSNSGTGDTTGSGNGTGWTHPSAGTTPNSRFTPSLRSRDAWTPPTPAAVTILTDPGTTYWVNHAAGKFDELGSTQHFVAVVPGTPDEWPTLLTTNDALKVFAWGTVPPPPVVVAVNTPYAFVGTVTGTTAATTTTPGTVSVTLTYTDPTSLLTGATGSQTFLLASSTNVFRTSPTGLGSSTLGAVSVGDTVAGGAIGAAGLSLSGFESTPLAVLIDIPPSSSAATTSQSALARVEKLLASKKSEKSRSHSKRERRNRRQHSRRHSRKHRRGTKRN